MSLEAAFSFLCSVIGILPVGCVRATLRAWSLVAP